MFGNLFASSKQKKADAVLQQLTSIAVQPVSDPRFEQSNALIRAYMVALGITVPQHVVSAAFPESVFPRWDDSVWRKDLSVFLDLAAMLAWRQCLAAFADLTAILEPSSVEAGRQDLMRVAGTMFPVSDRADALIQRYYLFETNPDSRKQLFEATPLSDIGPEGLRNMKHLEIHAWMVNEALDQPPLYQNDPAEFFALNLYLADIELANTTYFKERAKDLLSKHIAAGRP